MREMRRSSLSGFRFMMEEVQSKIQETLPGPLLLGRLALITNLVPCICTPRFMGLSIIPGYCRVPKINHLCLCWWLLVYHGLSIRQNMATMVTVMRSKSLGCHCETWQDRFFSNRVIGSSCCWRALHRALYIIDPDRPLSMNQRRYMCV